MVRQKMSYLEWWRSRFEGVAGYEGEARDFYGITKRAYEKEGLWPVSKLITLAYYLPAYIEIAKKYFSKIFFIDACAGCGLLKVKDRVFLGSALLAERAKASNGRGFDKVILIDNDRENAQALEKIVDKRRTEVIAGDLNKVLVGLIEQIEAEKQSHFVCFIDPEGMQEVPWSTMSKVFSSKGDIIFNYMCSGVAREIAIPNAAQSMSAFFGDDGWQRCRESPEKAECLFRHYLSNVNAIKPSTIDVMIQSDSAFHYHIIFAMKKGWERVIMSVRDKIEKVTPSVLEQLLNIHEGKQRPLFE